MSNFLKNLNVFDVEDLKENSIKPIKFGIIPIVQIHELYPKFSFRYLLNDEGHIYSFNQDEHWEIEDYRELINKFQFYNQKKFKDLFDNRNPKAKLKYELEVNNRNEILFNYLKENFAKDLIKDESPILFHFHLEHKNDIKANRANKIKCIVIHGFIALDCLYILFYDPYHEIQKTTF